MSFTIWVLLALFFLICASHGVQFDSSHTQLRQYDSTLPSLRQYEFFPTFARALSTNITINSTYCNSLDASCVTCVEKTCAYCDSGNEESSYCYDPAYPNDPVHGQCSADIVHSADGENAEEECYYEWPIGWVILWLFFFVCCPIICIGMLFMGIWKTCLAPRRNRNLMVVPVTGQNDPYIHVSATQPGMYAHPAATAQWRGGSGMDNNTGYMQQGGAVSTHDVDDMMGDFSRPVPYSGPDIARRTDAIANHSDQGVAVEIPIVHATVVSGDTK